MATFLESFVENKEYDSFIMAAKSLGATHHSPFGVWDGMCQLWRPSERFPDSYAELTLCSDDDGKWLPIGDWYLFNFELPENSTKID